MGRLAEGFRAGLQTGGRFGGIGAGLKQVLANMQQNTKLETAVGMEKMQQQGAYSRKMLEEGYNLDTGTMMGAEALPAEMQEHYSLYRGKPYKIKSIAGEYFPGESQAMGIAYMDYVLNNLKKSDPLLASELKTKWATRRREMASDMLGLNAGEVPEAAPQQNSFWGNFKQNLANNPTVRYFTE